MRSAYNPARWVGLLCSLVLSIISVPALAGSLTVVNQSKEPATIKLIRVAGDAPEVKTVAPSEETTFPTTTFDGRGRYVIKVRYGNPGHYTYARSVMIRVPNESGNQVYALSLTLRGAPIGPGPTWEATPEKDYDQSAVAELDKPIDLIMASVKAMLFAPTDKSFEARLAYASGETQLFVDVMLAAEKITANADREDAVKKLSDLLATATSGKSPSPEDIAIARRAISALGCFPDLRSVIEPGLVKLGKHGVSEIAKAAAEGLKALREKPAATAPASRPKPTVESSPSKADKPAVELARVEFKRKDEGKYEAVLTLKEPLPKNLNSATIRFLFIKADSGVTPKSATDLDATGSIQVRAGGGWSSDGSFLDKSGKEVGFVLDLAPLKEWPSSAPQVIEAPLNSSTLLEGMSVRLGEGKGQLYVALVKYGKDGNAKVSISNTVSVKIE